MSLDWINMTDQDRNIRTLLVSFMVALMVMVPLRFIEVTKGTLEEANRVLGDTTVNRTVNRVVEKPVVLTNTELEAPYNKLEAEEVKEEKKVDNNCLTAGTASKMISTLMKTSGKIEEMTEEESFELFEKISKIEDRVCN